MVLGLKFPWDKYHQLFGHRRQDFKFDTSAGEEVRTTPLIERMLDVLDLDNPPTPAKHVKQVTARPPVVDIQLSLPLFFGLPCPQPRRVELKHPRPVRAVALRDALGRFEEVAQSTDGLWNCGSVAQSSHCAETDTSGYHAMAHQVSEMGTRRCGYDVEPYPSKGHAHPVDAAQHPAEVTFHAGGLQQGPFNHLLPTSQSFAKTSAMGNISSHPPAPSPPEAKLTGLRPSGGLACLSPGFLDHFPGYASRGDPPRPTFVLQRSPPRTISTASSPSLSSPSLAIPSCPIVVSQSEVVRGSISPRRSAEIDDEEKLEYFSYHVEDECTDGDSDNQSACMLSPDNEDVQSFCTASDESFYDDDTGYYGDDEGAEDIVSPRASPRPASSSPNPSIRLVTSTASSTAFEPLPFENAGRKFTSIYEEVMAFMNRGN